LNFPKPFAGQYLLPFNHAAHPDAREATFCFVKRHWPRAGGRERSAPVDSPRIYCWELPEPLAQSAHPYKYRLYYGAGGDSRVRYDNERGKGDHRHIGEKEEDYTFTTIDRLLDDFERDIANWRES